MKVINTIRCGVLIPLGLAGHAAATRRHHHHFRPASTRSRLAPPYTSLSLAKSAGYNTQLTDCMSNGDIGAFAPRTRPEDIPVLSTNPASAAT